MPNHTQTELTTIESTQAAELTAHQNYLLRRALIGAKQTPISKEFAAFIEAGRFNVYKYMIAQGLTEEDSSYNQLRTQIVSYALTNWYCNQTSPEFSPFISDGCFDFGGYLMGLGFTVIVTMEGVPTSFADLTNFTLDLAYIAVTANPPFTGGSILDNVMLGKTSFQNGMLRLYNLKVTNFIMSEVIVEGLSFYASGAMFVNSTFGQLYFNFFPMLTESFGSQPNLTFSHCHFLNRRPLTTPVQFDLSNPLILQFIHAAEFSSYAQENNIIYAVATAFENCGFGDFPLNNMYTQLTYVNAPSTDGVSDSLDLIGAAGQLAEPAVGYQETNGKLTQVTLTGGLILQGTWPVNLAFNSLKATLVFWPGLDMQGADFSYSTIYLSFLQKFDQVMINWANFTNTTILYKGQSYMGGQIKSLFASLGMPAANLNTINVGPVAALSEQHSDLVKRALISVSQRPVSEEFAPYVSEKQFDLYAYMQTQGLTQDDTSYDQLRTQIVSYALTNWYCNKTSPEFTPFIDTSGMFDLGGYLIGLGFTTVNDTILGGSPTVLADLTNFTLDLLDILYGANPPFTGGGSVLDNVKINNTSFENGVLKLYSLKVTNFTMSDTIVEGLSFYATGAKFVNCVLSQLYFNFFPMLTTSFAESQVALTFTNCDFINRRPLTTPVQLDLNNPLVSQFIKAAESPNYAQDNNIIYAEVTAFENCGFGDFPLNNMYTQLTYVNAPNTSGVAEGLDFIGTTGALAEPVTGYEKTNGKYTQVTLTSGFILQGTWPVNLSFSGIKATLVFWPGLDMQGADFSYSTINLSFVQTFDQVMINWANFTNATIIYKGQSYMGGQIKSLFAELGMSQVNLNTIEAQVITSNASPVVSLPTIEELDDETSAAMELDAPTSVSERRLSTDVVTLGRHPSSFLGEKRSNSLNETAKGKDEEQGPRPDDKDKDEQDPKSDSKDRDENRGPGL